MRIARRDGAHEEIRLCRICDFPAREKRMRRHRVDKADLRHALYACRFLHIARQAHCDAAFPADVLELGQQRWMRLHFFGEQRPLHTEVPGSHEDARIRAVDKACLDRAESGHVVDCVDCFARRQQLARSRPAGVQEV